MQANSLADDEVLVLLFSGEQIPDPSPRLTKISLELLSGGSGQISNKATFSSGCCLGLVDDEQSGLGPFVPSQHSPTWDSGVGLALDHLAGVWIPLESALANCLASGWSATLVAKAVPLASGIWIDQAARVPTGLILLHIGSGHLSPGLGLLLDRRNLATWLG